MVLGDDWKVVLDLQKQYSKMLRDEGENQTAMNEVQAMTLLHHNGAERTTIQRREEVRGLGGEKIFYSLVLLLSFPCFQILIWTMTTASASLNICCCISRS